MPKVSIITKFVILNLTIVLVAGTIVFTLKDKIVASARKINEKQNMLAAIEIRENNLASLKADYEIVKEKMPIMRTMLPDEDNIGAAIDRLESLAIQTGNVQVLNFERLSRPESLEIANSISYTATLTGNIGSFVSYFDGIKKLPYPIEISSISIANGSGISENNTRLNYGAKIFIKKN